MKVKYLAALAIASLIGVGSVSLSSQYSGIKANPCASENPCAAVDPCAGINPCAAADPCAANPCAAADPCAANPCAAVDLSSFQQAPVYSDPTSGLAIRGYDPVAYFTEGEAVAGSADFQHEWQGATWQFSSAENLVAFASNPEAYAPQYGGYCAKALSEGNLASIDPEAWRIVDGELYLNYSPEVQQQWLQDVPGNIAKGDANWPEILDNDVVYE